MANCFQKNFPAEDDFPNFTGHKSLLSQHCTKELYAKLRDVYTASGFTLDKLIQNGTDNSGKYNKYLFLLQSIVWGYRFLPNWGGLSREKAGLHRIFFMKK